MSDLRVSETLFCNRRETEVVSKENLSELLYVIRDCGSSDSAGGERAGLACGSPPPQEVRGWAGFTCDYFQLGDRRAPDVASSPAVVFVFLPLSSFGIWLLQHVFLNSGTFNC